MEAETEAGADAEAGEATARGSYSAAQPGDAEPTQGEEAEYKKLIAEQGVSGEVDGEGEEPGGEGEEAVAEVEAVETAPPAPASTSGDNSDDDSGGGDGPEAAAVIDPNADSFVVPTQRSGFHTLSYAGQSPAKDKAGGFLSTRTRPTLN